uniref:Peptidase S1 domain-containing protein n=1 Tax=Labrus bergylta TaxID=56723 RepID=A0A3Q3F8K5_9LABR
MQHITCNNNDHVAFTFNTHTVSLIPHQSLPLSPLVSQSPLPVCTGCNVVMGAVCGSLSVRVHGSSFLLQIYSSQSKNWRTVCSRGWSDLQGKASCSFKFSLKLLLVQSVTTLLCFFSLVIKGRFSWLVYLLIEATCRWNISSLTAVFVSDCGTGVNSSRASGGQPASLGSWPWQVSLQVAGSHRCGGAVISPYWIVTAADCVASGCVLIQLRSIYSLHVIAHEGYNSFTLKSDIALMRLSKPLDHTDSGSPYLMEAQVSLVDAADCNSSTAYNGRITQDMLCAREVEAAKSFSQTDSGSPLVALKDGVWWLIGDCIRGQDCTEHQRPGVYGKIPFFLDWIFQQMRVIKDTD